MSLGDTVLRDYSILIQSRSLPLRDVMYSVAVPLASVISNYLHLIPIKAFTSASNSLADLPRLFETVIQAIPFAVSP